MTVRDLIMELLCYPMDAEITKSYLVGDGEGGFDEMHEEPCPEFFSWSDGTYSVRL